MRFILFPLALPSLGYHPHISLDFTGWGDSEGPHGPQVSAHLLTLETSLPTCTPKGLEGAGVAKAVFLLCFSLSWS